MQNDKVISPGGATTDKYADVQHANPGKEHLVAEAGIYTRDFPENLRDGIMICGILDLHSSAINGAGKPDCPVARSFFSDEAVNNTHFRNQILRWLDGWGIYLGRSELETGGFERSFFETRWLSARNISPYSEYVINRATLVSRAHGLLEQIEQRQPSVILLFGELLFDAFTDERLQNRLELILGFRDSNIDCINGDPRLIDGEPAQLRSLLYGNTRVIGMPHPGRTDLSTKYMQSLKPPLYIIHRLLEKRIQHISGRSLQ